MHQECTLYHLPQYSHFTSPLGDTSWFSMPPEQCGHLYFFELPVRRICCPIFEMVSAGLWADLENATPNPKAINANPISDAKIRKNNGGEPKVLKGVLHMEMMMVKPIIPNMAKITRKKMGKPDFIPFGPYRIKTKKTRSPDALFQECCSLLSRSKTTQTRHTRPEALQDIDHPVLFHPTFWGIGERHRR